MGRIISHKASLLSMVNRAVETKLDVASEMIAQEAARLMDLPHHGRDYRKNWRKEGRKSAGKGNKAGYFKVVSAAEGEAPAVQSGKLKRSITWIRPSPLVRRVGTPDKVGWWQEVGTDKMPAHPFLRPAIDNCRERIKRLFGSLR